MHELNEGLYHAAQDTEHSEFSWGLENYKVVCKIYNYSKGLSLFCRNCLFYWGSKQCQEKRQHFIVGKGHNVLYLSSGSLHAVFALWLPLRGHSLEDLSDVFSGITQQDRKEIIRLWMFLRTPIEDSLQRRVFPKAKQIQDNTMYCLKSWNHLIVQIPINIIQQFLLSLSWGNPIEKVPSCTGLKGGKLFHITFLQMQSIYFLVVAQDLSRRVNVGGWLLERTRGSSWWTRVIRSSHITSLLQPGNTRGIQEFWAGTPEAF